MNDVTIFCKDEFGAVRAVMLEGEPWFVAADVCRALGLGNSSDVIKRLDEDERTLVSIEGASNGLPVNAVNEPGLYALILGSRKPEAKAFKRWITHEVIPEIRKTGGYIAGQEMMDDDQLLANALMVAQRKIAERNKQLEAANEKIKADAPKVLFAETVEKAETCISIGTLAKILNQAGLDIGERRLFERLRNDKWLNSKGRNWNVPSQKSKDMGLMRVHESTISRSSGIQIKKTPLITGKGQRFFLDLYAPKATQERLPI
ncbi:phage antirepressor KilAC domain-containing protein [Hominenteromicrobium sp.]|uniref:phage antirepressor KilAC domain-containing protein n=1 Tax=Hominenteromicrobium sp. TaxID=3073581 RepID=UPI003A913AA1